MNIKVGDIVITNGHQEYLYSYIKRKYNWIGKVKRTNGRIAEAVTIYSTETNHIGKTNTCYVESLTPINEAIRTGIMYEDLEREEPTIRIEQGIHHIQTGTFRLANEADAIANELITQLRNNQFIDNIRNMIEGDLYGRRRNQR